MYLRIERGVLKLQQDVSWQHQEIINAVNNKLDAVMEKYSTFLHDGDFENHHAKNYPIPKSLQQYITNEIKRLMWIRKQYTPWGEEQWCKYDSYYQTLR